MTAVVTTEKHKNATVKLPMRVKPFLYNRRLCITIPQDLAKLIDVHEDNAEFDLTLVEGGLFYQLRRPEL